jgi:LysM repeat protein
MLLMVRKDLAAIAGLLAAIFITGCSGVSSGTPQSTLTIAPPQNPYQSSTHTPDAPTETVNIPTEQPRLPSPTPFKHSIQPGDTLYGIALQYNISLDSLVSANPEVNTSILTVGTELTIPFSDEDNLSIPTPTPFVIPLGNPVCYSSRTGGAWCIALVENDQAISLENIAIAINIYDRGQELMGSYIAIPPLNNLPPGQTLPMITYIEDDLPDPFQATAVLLTSLPSDDYVPQTEIIKQFYLYQDQKKTAVINGSIQVSGPVHKESQIWIAAVAFSDGSPVGVRKWISSGDISAGEEIPFELVVYSLGPPIDEIILFSELY